MSNRRGWDAHLHQAGDVVEVKRTGDDLDRIIDLLQYSQPRRREASTARQPNHGCMDSLDMNKQVMVTWRRGKERWFNRSRSLA